MFCPFDLHVSCSLGQGFSFNVPGFEPLEPDLAGFGPPVCLELRSLKKAMAYPRIPFQLLLRPCMKYLLFLAPQPRSTPTPETGEEP